MDHNVATVSVAIALDNASKTNSPQRKMAVALAWRARDLSKLKDASAVPTAIQSLFYSVGDKHPQYKEVVRLYRTAL